jgi:hypothetical protein
LELSMLNGRLNRFAAAPSGLTNVASFYTSTANSNQTAIMAGYTPTQWATLTPAQQQAALAATSGSAVANAATQGGTVNTASTALIQKAIAAGLTPTQYAALTPAQQLAASQAASKNTLMPMIILFGGAALLLMNMEKTPARRRE